ncbi:TMEM175 family protein [Leifsonia sp. AG29]|uniref:TMEM175 family protein n=1 Tax=Leifsonia sp. AG29 TaxID=2598860 RepID=UPI00131CBD5B|nr:TMEM175 family protein [Leifsonia sp. AG29]
MSKTRLEAFSDGVLAVAITLLVLDLHVDPGKGGSLLAQLGAAWPSFVAYVVSFLVIGVIWVNHHSIFRFAVTIDRLLLFWNLMLLMFVTTIPFTTSTLAGALADGDASDVRVAAVLYGGATTGFAVAFTFVWGRITLDLLRSGAMGAPERKRSMLRFSAGTVLYPILTLVGVLYAPAMLAGFALVSVYYLFNQTGASEA